MNFNATRIGFATMILLVSASFSSALAQDRPAPLIEDIRQYYLTCGTINSTSPRASSCGRQKSVLLGRQKALGLGSGTINALLNGTAKAQGEFRWPG